MFSADNIIRAFFFGVGIVVATKLFNWIREASIAKRKVELQEIDLERKAIKTVDDSLPLGDLIDRANKRANPDDPKG